MSGFPELEDITVESSLAWCLAAFTFFEAACRSDDKAQLQASGCIGYGMHNVPGLIQKLQQGEEPIYSVYGDMSHRLESPPTKALVQGFFAQDLPGIPLPEGTVLPKALVEAMYCTMQAFRIGFRPGNVFATEEGWEERRQTTLQIVVAMQAHLY